MRGSRSKGLCVPAGIPTTEKAAEIISGLKSVGIRHVSFKPGSVDGICQLVNIAAADPDFAIIMQWTGGRAGGHHSFEYFDQPILATYSSICRHDNIARVAGSGGLDDTWPYLTTSDGRSNSAWSRCHLMGSSSRLVSWLPRRRAHPPSKDFEIYLCHTKPVYLCVRVRCFVGMIIPNPYPYPYHDTP